MLRRNTSEFNRVGHLSMLAITILVYSLTLTAFLMYEMSYKIEWFHTAYIANATGIILAIWVSIPRLVHFLSKSEEKVSAGMYYEPILSGLSLLPFVFTFIIHCDQWNAVQPFVGESIQLVLLSILLMSGAAVAGFLSGFKTLPRIHPFKLNKTTFHLPF